ncbi:hypothetical protein CARUB_v10021636mg [Capsella rubella]|uniref:Uncharacterized protein n=1 Tax=Capsella rubella TaxID=81985 RepID=R0HWC2_9BRAS|nr:hypothetical protein CARUB_v10021636mg [Capsella rubella]
MATLHTTSYTCFFSSSSSLSLIMFAFLTYIPTTSVFVQKSSTVIFYNKCKDTVLPGSKPSAGEKLLAGGGFELPTNKSHTVQLPPLCHKIPLDELLDSGGVLAVVSTVYAMYFLCSCIMWVSTFGFEDESLLYETYYMGRLTHTLGFCVFLCLLYSISLLALCIGLLGFLWFVTALIAPCCNCSYAGCVSDLNQMCPVGLQVMSCNGKQKSLLETCKSACSVFKLPKYCCTGLFGNPISCKPTAYSKIFKTACPTAYSYAYNHPTSIFTCSNANYIVTIVVKLQK